MRPRSRFTLTPLFVSLAVLSLASSASAGNAEQIDPAAFKPITHVSIDSAADRVTAWVDSQLGGILAGPTTMDCSYSLESGYETCVVRTQGAASTAPASIARN